MLVKWMLHWYVDTFFKTNVWACLRHGSWDDASAIVKPCLGVGVFGGGTVHLFRVLSELLYCSVVSNFSNFSGIGNLSHRKPLIVILNWFPCVVSCSVRSSGRPLFTQATMFLAPLRHFHPAFLGASTAFHGLIIELHVDCASRECEGFIILIFTETR